MKNSLKIMLISLIIGGLGMPAEAVSPQKRLASFGNRLKKEVNEFVTCVKTRGKDCDSKRKKIYKTVTVIVSILAVAVVVGTGLYFRPKGKQQKKEEESVLQKKDFSQEEDVSEGEEASEDEELSQEEKDQISNLSPKELGEELIVAAGKGDVELVRALLKVGADPDSRNKFGDTGLLFSARLGNVGTVNELLAGGADPNIIGRAANYTALTWAAHAGHEKVVEVLLASDKLSDQTIRGALETAKKYNKTEIIELLKQATQKKIVNN